MKFFAFFFICFQFAIVATCWIAELLNFWCRLEQWQKKPITQNKENNIHRLPLLHFTKTFDIIRNCFSSVVRFLTPEKFAAPYQRWNSNLSFHDDEIIDMSANEVYSHFRSYQPIIHAKMIQESKYASAERCCPRSALEPSGVDLFAASRYIYWQFLSEVN